MATTETIQNGDGGNIYSFSFAYLKTEDVKVELQEFDSTQSAGNQIISRQTTTAFTIPLNQPTQVELSAISSDTVYQTANGNVRTTSTNGYTVRVRIYRFTDADSTPATFTAGTSIRAGDLNDNFEQILFIMQERQNTLQTISTGGIGENVISTAALQDNSVTSDKLSDSTTTDSVRAVTTNHIRDNAVTTAKIANGAITTAKIANGTIVNADVNASAAIDGTKISPNFGSQTVATSGTANLGSVSVTTQNTTDLLQGVSITNDRDSSADDTVSFIDFKNNVDIPDAHIFGEHLTDGSSVLRFAVTPAGARNTDRRVEAMRITDDGIGIGTTTPIKSKVHLSGAGQTAALTDAGSVGDILRLSSSGFLVGSGGSIAFSNVQGDTASSVGFAAIKSYLRDGSNNGSGHISFQTRNSPADTSLTERLRITSDGSIFTQLFPATSSAGAATPGVIHSAGYAGRQGYGGTAFGNVMNFFWTGANLESWVDVTKIGNITITSDYRTKREIATQTESGIDKVKQLRPVTFKRAAFGELFQDEDVVREGFIAHEVAEVIPSGCEGEKDAEHQIQSLNVDAIVSVLTKALQETVAKVETLEAKVAALEAV